MTFWQFAGDHPFVAIVLGLIAATVAFYPFWIVNRAFRSHDIRAHGWPPPHLDADGDPIERDDDK